MVSFSVVEPLVAVNHILHRLHLLYNLHRHSPHHLPLPHPLPNLHFFACLLIVTSRYYFYIRKQEYLLCIGFNVCVNIILLFLNGFCITAQIHSRIIHEQRKPGSRLRMCLEGIRSYPSRQTKNFHSYIGCCFL